MISVGATGHGCGGEGKGGKGKREKNDRFSRASSGGDEHGKQLAFKSSKRVGL